MLSTYIPVLLLVHPGPSEERVKRDARDNRMKMAPDSYPPYVPVPPDKSIWNPPPAGTNQGQSHPASLLIVGILLVVVGIFASVGMRTTGAPVEFALLPIAFGVVLIIAFPIVLRMEEEKKRQIESMAELEQERFKDEVAEAVQQKMKGVIKVRCRYCGSLNDEASTKCDSCGAAL